MDKHRIKILYIDDEINNLSSFKATFRHDYDISIAISTAEAREILAKSEIEIIISDQRMPQQTGVDFFSEILEEYPDIIRILLTGYADLQAVIDAVNKGKIHHYLNKPWDEKMMRDVFEKFYKVYATLKEKKQLTEDLARVNQQLEFLLRQNLLS